MICAWDNLIHILPPRLRDEVDRRGRNVLQELRLRLKQPPLLCMEGTSVQMEGSVTQEDISYVINAVSRYSPWAAGTMSQGFLTGPGGHRVGLCGEAIVKEGVVTGLRRVESLNIRVARAYPGIADKLGPLTESVLLIGPPGSGKTTLLRDILTRLSKSSRVSVVDERQELFPPDCLLMDHGMDVLSGCPKSKGIEMLLRSMGPEWIGVDEITAADDCEALSRALWCGVRLIATAHAADLRDLRSSSIYRPILDSGAFKTVCVLRPDKSYYIERLYP